MKAAIQLLTRRYNDAQPARSLLTVRQCAALHGIKWVSESRDIDMYMQKFGKG